MPTIPNELLDMLLYSGSMESKAYTETQIKLYIPGFTL